MSSMGLDLMGVPQTVLDAVDASEHYQATFAEEELPSLCTIVLDTNPRAWALLNDVLPLSRAVANIIVFLNAHLACNSANQVAIIASHTNRAVWLYPSPPKPSSAVTGPPPEEGDGDIEMIDAHAFPKKKISANKYPQFAAIESSLLASIRDLITSTSTEAIQPTTTLLSGAITQALCHINKTALSLSASTSTSTSNPTPMSGPSKIPSRSSGLPGLHARILVLSVSDSAPEQYIPTMNAVFAASHLGIPIDTLSLRGESSFLQQAAYITRGAFVNANANPRGLLTYLMFGFSSGEAADQLVAPAADVTDFRAACFCHRRVIDTGYVCSICLSIFCEPPSDGECLTCGTKLELGSYGAKPAVVPRVKRRKKRKLGEEGGSATGTPGGTPGM